MIGVIADDLTGAAELGAFGWRHGLRAEVLLAGEPSGDADLVCLDTDSRSCAPVEAAEHAARAARLLRQQQAGWIYKKTDSVLRGNVTPELEAIVSELGLNGALLVPANPSLGRTVAGGQYFVRGHLISETEFARDPKHPRLSSNVSELVHAPAALQLFVQRPGRHLPEGGMVIGEAASLDDLCRWAALWDASWLMAGGAEFFAALLRLPTLAGHGVSTPGGFGSPRRQIESCAFLGEQALPAKELFVCGSASEVTGNFVAGQQAQGVPAFSLPQELAEVGSVELLVDRVVEALQSRERVILRIGLPLIEDIADAQTPALHLVRVAERVIHRARVVRVFAEGGATAVALARQLGWHRLRVTAELAPGVVTLSPQGGSSALFTIKPGTYPWPESLARLVPR